MLKLNLAIAKEVATGKGKIDIFLSVFLTTVPCCLATGSTTPVIQSCFPVTPDIYWMAVETTLSFWANGAVQQSMDQPENARYDEINGNDITQ